ncbi:MAG TPA: alpha/beta fold hydrolase [Streptosporangiaceae bacterium]|nr:alpha/beta fold hydrolase [Streptosporangiaceae bacterium]
MTSVRGVVVVAHGGQSVSTEPTTAYQLAVLRMIPLVAAIRHAVRGRGVVVRRPRFEVRGWNDASASPVRDLTRILDDLRAEFGPAPVVLVGHSMGARAALRAAGHPSVAAAAGLAPWLPPGEPVGQLTGRRILLAHGTADAVTSPADTWRYAERARALTSVTEIEVRTGEHTMLWRAPLWHGLAAAFTCLSLGLPAPSGAAAAAVADARPPQRTVL